jgi:hypothetical protein
MHDIFANRHVAHPSNGCEKPHGRQSRYKLTKSDIYDLPPWQPSSIPERLPILSPLGGNPAGDDKEAPVVPIPLTLRFNRAGT